MRDISQARALLRVRETARLPDTGDMRERIKIERQTSTPDGAGGFTRVWTPYGGTAGKRWAEVAPTAGRETLLNEALQGIQGYRVTVRWDATIKVDDRIDWNGVKMNIRSAADPNGLKTYTVIFADAGVATQ
jgi:SPP1 family predicted phage head-tail adaptor